jgi:gliding motility-associated-like protein
LANVNGLPQLNEAFVNGLLCENNNLEFYTTYLENASYSWIGPNGFISNEQNPIINNGTDLHNGIYTVTATVDGCESLPVNIDVEVHMLPELILSQACNNMDYELSFDLHPVNGITNTISNLEWVGPNGFASNNEIVAITRGELGIYGLTVALDNGCSISSNLYVNRTNCFIPNVITPNNDGFNDSLELTGFNVKRIEIYNRWGRLVYDKNDYLNQWYGQTNSGELLPDSTYYYLIFIEGEANNTGWIYLNRG